MANEINVSASRRPTVGTSVARGLRRKGILPANLCDEHGHSVPIQLPVHGFEQMLSKHTGENLLINLTIDGEPEKKVLLREVQHDPVHGMVRHADFVEISMTKAMRVTVPVELTGDPVGVTQQGGVLEQMLREIEIECLPADLIEELLVDVSGLKLGESLHVSDLVVPPAVTVLDDGDIAVATVAALRTEEDKTAEDDTGGAAEPEVIKVRKEKEEGSGTE